MTPAIEWLAVATMFAVAAWRLRRWRVRRRPIVELGRHLPLVVATLCLCAYVLVPRQAPPARAAFLLGHYLGIGGLGAFLSAAAFFHVRWLCSAGAQEAVRASRRLWLLTELVPGSAALLIVLSGLRLVFESSQTLQQGWLFWLVAAFAFFFVDGLQFFLPATRALHRATLVSGRTAERPGNSGPTRLGWRDAQMAVHYASFPFVFLLGWNRWPMPHPSRGAIAALENRLRFLPAGWPEAVTAVVLVAGVAGLLAACRAGGRNGKRRLPCRRTPRLDGDPRRYNVGT